MTIIELIDAAPIHNIMGAMAFNAEKIIYVGSVKEEKFRKSILPDFERFYNRKEYENISFEYVQIIKNDFDDICTKLNRIISENKSCYFDISGGEDIILTALGFVFAENPDIHLYQINPATGRIHIYESQQDSDGNRKTEKISKSAEMQNTVEENIIAHGGTVVYDTEKTGCTHIWQFSIDFCHDIRKMWDICCNGPSRSPDRNDNHSYPRFWNSVTTALGLLEEINNSDNPDELLVSIEKAKSFVKKQGGHFPDNYYLYALMKAGLISYGKNNSENVLHIIYKNKQVKLCLTKAGVILELKTYIICEQLINDDKFTDCMTGVTIDWDSVVHDEAADANEYYRMNVMERLGNIEDTVNEVDVILMRGIIPYFISCKNGKFTAEELYKLNTIKNKFGTIYGKMFIITTDFDNSSDEYALEYLQQRADDMGITIIKNVHLMSDEEFEKKLLKKLMA
ncbi:MAG: hypothetical protein J6Q94_07210 [Clostridia bacterium]|nr:hypothetical protein [Clostridia bacterium]